MNKVQNICFLDSKDNKDIYEKAKPLLDRIEPKFLESFELLEFLGQGSESEVYKAYIKSSKKVVAMKMILIKKGRRKNKNEINISKKLKHKNIINFYVAGEFKKNELYCIVTDYAKYGNLRQFQKLSKIKSNLSESLICFLAYQILEGLKYCHLCKIIHFDLKPQNILIDNNLNVKIIDFSISLEYNKIISDKIKIPIRGSKFYIAPEIIKNDTIKIEDFNKIDIFSFGVILYNLAFDSYPFFSEDINSFEQIDLKELNTINKYYSLYFIDFLKKLLEKDINKRINIEQALNDYWIKGVDILFKEKEKLNNDDIFLSHLIYDNFWAFNHYIKK